MTGVFGHKWERKGRLKSSYTNAGAPRGEYADGGVAPGLWLALASARLRTR